MKWKKDRPCAGRRVTRSGINDGIAVYLDESLKQFTTVYPAAGNDHSAIKTHDPELEKVAGAKGWVDVCKEPEE